VRFNLHWSRSRFHLLRSWSARSQFVAPATAQAFPESPRRGRARCRSSLRVLPRCLLRILRYAFAHSYPGSRRRIVKVRSPPLLHRLQLALLVDRCKASTTSGYQNSTFILPRPCSLPAAVEPLLDSQRLQGLKSPHLIAGCQDRKNNLHSWSSVGVSSLWGFVWMLSEMTDSLRAASNMLPYVS
jgi:hypothetical protein